MDFDKTRTEIRARQETLKARQVDIVAERKRLDEETMKIQWELAGLDQMLEGIDVAVSNTPPDLEELGFTDKVRKILQDTKTALVPTQIRDLLMMQGVTGSSPKNLLILVHGVLTRIEKELIVGERNDGKTTYIAKPNPKPAVKAVIAPPVGFDIMSYLYQPAPSPPPDASRRARRLSTLGERLANPGLPPPPKTERDK